MSNWPTSPILGTGPAIAGKKWYYASTGVYEREPLDIGNLTGPTGITGITGPIGVTGPTGSDIWYAINVPYKVITSIFDLTSIINGSISSFYIQVTSLFGVKHEAPAKKVSMVATRVSEFAVHELSDGSIKGAHVKTQHTGVYAKYGSNWDNIPVILDVNRDNVKVYISGNDIVVYHIFDKGENITPTLSCKYKVEIQTLNFE